MIKSINKKHSKKVLSGIAVLALTAAASLGTAVALLAEKNGDFGLEPAAVYAATSDTVSQGNPHNKISGKKYYVTPSAEKNDEAADGSKAHPYNILTLLNSSTLLKPGDTVLLAEGEYNLGLRSTEGDQKTTTPADERITMTVSGSHRGYITIKPEVAGSQVTLNFSDMNFSGSNRGVSIYGNYIYWYDVDVMGAGDNGLYIGGSYNIVEDCEFYNNRDTGLQLGRSYSDESGTKPEWNSIDNWPSYNVIKNCTSHNNYDNETYGENADGFAAKLTVGYGNVFDGCIAYRNSDDGWDLFAKVDSGNIGSVILYNCVAFENGFIECTRDDFNATQPAFNEAFKETDTNSYTTKNGDGNGFKLGGESMEADVFLYNCLSFNNRMNGFTDNSNPGFIHMENCTSFNNSAVIENFASNAELFGHIKQGKSDETHGNVDLSRQDYSYNSISRVLGLYNDIVEKGSLSNDVIRGSAQYSILDGKVKIDEYIDADVKKGVTGKEIAALNPDAVFEKLPVVLSGGQYTYNLEGKDDGGMNATTGIMESPNRVHLKYRNSDGSVNMGDILKIKDYSLLFGDTNKIGSDLTATSWSKYKHYFKENLSSASNAYNATALAIKDALYIPTAEGAVYQDFDIPSKMMGAQINWKSSDTDVVSFSKSYTVSQQSGAEYLTAIVNRPATDTTVKLTANINYRGVTQTKTFTITVKARVFKIGSIGVENYIDGTTATISRGGSGVITVDDGSTLVVDRYAIFNQPEVFVYDGSDYNGKRIDPSLYDMTTLYEYSAAGMTGFNEGKQEVVAGFTTSRAGTFRITYSVRPKGDKFAEPVEFVYYINVAAMNAESVGFLGDPVVTVNRDGFSLKGKTTNGIGNIYAISLTESEKSELSGSLVDVAYIQSHCTDEASGKHNFRGDEITEQFINDNTEAYTIYYIFSNGKDQITSSEVKSIDISVVNIDSEDTFKTLVANGAVADETPSQTIYLLSGDLDFGSTANNFTPGAKPFSGFLNGGNHTIKGISMSGKGAKTGIFQSIDGGTIKDIVFEDISITGATGNQVGIIATMTSGYLSGIRLKNVTITSSGNSIGGLVGQLTTVDKTTPGEVYIDKIGVYGCKVESAGGRLGGIVGAAQVDGTTGTWIKLVAENCVIDDKTVVGSETQNEAGDKTYGGEYAGGAFGRLQNQNANNAYTFRNIYCAATVRSSKNGCAGIVAAFNSANENTVVENCVFSGTLFFGTDQNALVEPQKYSSGIVGKAASGIIVKNCGSTIEEYTEDYKLGVLKVEQTNTFTSTFFWNDRGYKLDEVWKLVTPDGGGKLYADLIWPEA